MARSTSLFACKQAPTGGSEVNRACVEAVCGRLFNLNKAVTQVVFHIEKVKIMSAQPAEFIMDGGLYFATYNLDRWLRYLDVMKSLACTIGCIRSGYDLHQSIREYNHGRKGM